MSRQNGQGHRRRAVTLSATGSHTTSTWHFAFGLLDDLFLSSPAPKATTPSFVDVFRREGMSEECVKRKVSRAAKRVLASDPQLGDNMYVLLIYPSK